MSKISLFNLAQMGGVMSGKVARGQSQSQYPAEGNFSVALYEACRLMAGNVRANENFFVGKTKNGVMVAEYGTSVALYNGTQIRACDVLPAGVQNTQQMIVVMLCLFQKFMENSEFNDFYQLGKNLFERDLTMHTVWDPTEVDTLVTVMATLTSNAVCRVMDYNTAELCEKGSGIANNAANGVTKPTQAQLDACKEVDWVAGKAQTFFVVSNSGAALQNAKEYYLTQKEYEGEELKRMEAIPSWYVMPKFVIKLARKIKFSTNFVLPIRTALIESPAGLGKTEACKALSALLNLPYSTTVCNADSEIFDFLGQVFPVGSDKAITVSEIGKELGVSIDDIEFDPKDAYFRLTGKKKDSVVLEDVYAEYTQAVLNFYSKNVSTNGFTYVESELIKACRHGWLHEIQEPKVIRRPGVLVGLNELLTNQGTINLPTGEVLKKNTNTVIIMTTNKDYAGCDSLNASVISRNADYIKLDGLTEDELVERAFGVTGLDRKWLQKMAKTVVKGQEYLYDNEIKDGVIGPRELFAWASSVKIMGDFEGQITEELIVEEAYDSLINKVSQNDDDLNGFIEGPFKDVWGALVR